MKLLKKLEQQHLISPPPWLSDNMLYANIHGSEMYGCATDTSDKDIYGICIPPVRYLFPHTEGWINGFGSPPTFENWQKHAIEFGNKKYDFQVFNVTRFLWLAMDGNPNVLECLFAPQDCVLHQVQAFQPILDHKCELLTQKTIPRFRGYAISQLHKMKSKEPVGKRVERVEKYGFDTKFASHTLRLLYFAEQILKDRYLDVRRDRELIKSIKRGDWTLEQVEELAQNKMIELDKLVMETTLPEKPDTELFRTLLLNLIESHYGNLSKYMKEDSGAELKIRKIKEILGAV